MTPEKIGRYEVTGRLGQGAMGEVFRAHDPVLNRAVAVKRISAGLDADETVRKRFQREARSAANLSHPNIITVYELGLEGEQFFMAMELLEGIDLKHALAQQTLTLDEKLDITEQICEGLAYAHAHDVVHRDLKPANIHLLPGRKVKIMDFGLARTSGSDMTSTGTVMGTPHYMSPEQVRGARADTRSDVFSVGCVLYQLLTGRRPFDAESMHAVLFKVLQEEPTPARELVPDLSPAIVEVVDRALAKDPALRHQSAGEMLAALRRARQAGAGGRGPRAGDASRTFASPVAAASRPRPTDRPSASRSGSRSSAAATPKGRRSLVAPLLVFAAVILAAVVGAWLLRTWTQAPRPSAPPPEVASLAAAVIDTQVELARKKLETGDYADASRQAERALRLDPANADAKAIVAEAASALTRISAARAALREAGGGADAPRAAFELMKLDPRNPEAERVATAAQAAFRSFADEARGLAAQARAAAGVTDATDTAAYADAAALERQGQEAMLAGRSVAAAQLLLEARARFERAARPSP